MEERNILCIDLKSFFAAVECVERNLDMFKTPLVVTDTKRGNGAITLAVTPYLKKLGVKSRGRLFELPKNIKIIYAEPRHNLYIKKSKEVFKIFLEYISEEDFLPYSIDEAFLDITSYLKLYKKTDYELAEDILNKIKEKTGLVACCGIGPNLLLAKVALDVDSKHSPNGISKWAYDDIKEKLWNITPLTDMWGIGKSTAKTLNNLGINKVGDINKYSLPFYKKRFGIMGELLYMHANGIDNRTIKDEKNSAKNSSFSASHVLYRDYKIDECLPVLRYLCEDISRRLREKKKAGKTITLYVKYSNEISASYNHRLTLNDYTDDVDIIYKEVENIFVNYTQDLPIRKLGIAISKVEPKNCIQLNLFEEQVFNNSEINNYIDKMNKKLGNTALKKASSLVNNIYSK